ncbi:MAG TPA: toll/interleukin-1 receptor domain-containing protein [Chitinophagaceae bacterium]|jgi:hypothetical protein|nr:toll/interleukin-1 receptor domain-containing protein [Chitinophagaceae bacterium]
MGDTPLNTFANNNVKIFISYSSKDIDWMNDLLTQLNVLKINDKQLEIWQDGLLDPGIKWDAEIKAKLYTANIVLMLISANFLTSEYVTNIEIKETLVRKEKGDVVAIPVILKPCAWEQTPLAQFNALPRHGKPISQYGDRDSALYEVVTGVQRVIKKWRENKTIA